MGYRLNRLTEPVFIAVSKRLLTEFGIHYILESCALQTFQIQERGQRFEESRGEKGLSIQEPGRKEEEEPLQES